MTRARLKSGEPSEYQIQKTVIQWVRAHPELDGLVFHIANEGKRSKAYGRSLKDIGLLPGVADIFISMGRHGYHGAWLELKSKSGVVSLAQHKFLERQSQQGYYTAVCHNFDDAIEMIEWYCFYES